MKGLVATSSLDLALVLDPDEQVERTFCVQLAPEPQAVRQGREFVLAQVPGLGGEARDILKLLTSELVTNAVIHARTMIDLAVLLSDRHVVVTVHDLDIGHVTVSGVREGGWGLGLVRALAERSDLTRHPGGGKTAWFRLAR